LHGNEDVLDLLKAELQPTYIVDKESDHVDANSKMTILPETGWTPYMLAVARIDIMGSPTKGCRNNVAILDILTSIYADFIEDFSVLMYVTLPNILDMTAMDIALLNNDEEAYDLLNSLETFMNNQNDESEILSITTDVSDDKNVKDATESFLQAAMTGNVKLLKKLYESGTKVRGDFNIGGDAFVNAAKTGRSEIILLLLEWGVDIDSQDSTNGWTPLMYSKYYGHHKIENLLIAKGADKSMEAFDGIQWSQIEKHSKVNALLSTTAINAASMLSLINFDSGNPKQYHRLVRSLSLPNKRKSRANNSGSKQTTTALNKKGKIKRWWNNFSRKVLQDTESPSSEMSLKHFSSSSSSRSPFNDELESHRSDVKSSLARGSINQRNQNHQLSIDRSPYPRSSTTGLNPNEDSLKRGIDHTSESEARADFVNSMEEKTTSALIEEKHAWNEFEFLLKTLCLEPYIPAFIDQEIFDIDVFCKLSENDLSEMGIQSRSARSAIVSAIDELSAGRK